MRMGAWMFTFNFFYKNWLGEYPLKTAFWGFGLLGWWLWLGLCGVVILLPMKAIGLHAPGLAIASILMMAYTAFAIVGIWKSANVYAKEKPGSYNSLIAKCVAGFFVLYYLDILIVKHGAANLFDALNASY
jgi:hypothetical protein